MARRKRKRTPGSTAERPPFPRDASLEDEPGPDRWRPWLLGALCLLFVLRPLFPSESAVQGDGLVVVMLWIALAVLWLLGAVGRGQFRVRFGWVDAAVVLLVAWHSVAAVWATTRVSPRPAVNMLWEWVAYALCFLLARQLIVGRREARAMVAVMVGLAVALAGYGLYQYFCELPATRAEYRANPAAALEAAELNFAPGSREALLFEKRLESIEPIATFALANSLAGYLAPWLVVTVGIGVGAGLGRKQWRTWLALAACALPPATSLILTKSRSAFVAVAMGLLLVGLFRRGGKTRLGWRFPAAIAASAALLVAAVIAVGGLDVKVLSEASKSLGYRVQYWQSTLGMIADHPVVGCGPGNFQHTYTRYMLPEASEEIADPHNFLMEVWATAGTPALLALLAVLACFAVALVRGHRGHRGAEPSPRARGLGSEVDATPHVVGGAVCGFLLSVPIGQMGAAPPGIATVFVGLPLAVVAVALLWPWIDGGRMSPVAPAIGVVVVLTNLLAAGAMGFPGVVGTLWLLAALSLNLAETSRPRTHPRMVALAGLGVMMALALTCSSSAFKPVLTSQAAMRLAAEDGRDAVEHLKAAAVADPLAADPWRQLTQHAFSRWLKRPSPEAFDDFETAMKTALDLAPNSASTWRMLGDMYRQAFRKTGREELLRKEVMAYSRAVELYPTSAIAVASLALALQEAGDEAGFRQQAAESLRLDGITPHPDKKLKDDLRDELRRGLSRSSSRGD